jgi:hypothetical protein
LMALGRLVLERSFSEKKRKDEKEEELSAL